MFRERKWNCSAAWYINTSFVRSFLPRQARSFLFSVPSDCFLSVFLCCMICLFLCLPFMGTLLGWFSCCHCHFKNQLRFWAVKCAEFLVRHFSSFRVMLLVVLVKGEMIFPTLVWQYVFCIFGNIFHLLHGIFYVSM